MNRERSVPNTTLTEQVLIAIIGAIAASAASVLAFLKWLLPWAMSRRNDPVARGLYRLAEAYRAMAAMRQAGADRVMLFGAHNSGGVPRIGSPLYASAIHKSVDDVNLARVQDYRNVSVDAAYVEMLIAMYSAGRYHFRTLDHAPCLLRDFYEIEGVTDSYLYFLGIRENQFLYLSAAKYGGEFSMGELAKMKLQVDHIRLQLGGA